MKKLFYKIYHYVASKMIIILPAKFCLLFESIKTDILSFFIYKKLKDFSLNSELIDKQKKNILCFSEHPYTNKVFKNGINIIKDKFNLITFGKVFSIYTNISKGDRNSTFNMKDGGNYNCYKKLGKIYSKNNPETFNKTLIGACDFNLPTQIFNNQKKNIIYLNHRFPYLGFFNVFKISDWKKKINNLKQDNNILIAANNYDYEYHKYILGKDKNIFFIPPLTNNINEKYKGKNNSFLIVPGKNKIFDQRERIIDGCIEELQQFGINNILSITKKYKDVNYEFSEIAEYKALIVIPYTIYIGSITDFLEMGMPMFFPSVELLTKWHKEHNLLVEYDFISKYIQMFNRNIFTTDYINKIEKYIGHRDKPSPYSYKTEDLKYWISKSDWYTNWPIITFDSFDDLAKKIKETNMHKYSNTLLEFNSNVKRQSKKNWENLLKNF